MNPEFIELIKDLLNKYNYKYIDNTVELSFELLLKHTSLDDEDVTRIIKFMNEYFKRGGKYLEKIRLKDVLEILITFQKLNSYNVSLLNLDVINKPYLVIFQNLSESFMKDHYSWLEENRYGILGHQVIPDHLLPKSVEHLYKAINYKTYPRKNMLYFPKYLRGFKFIDNKLLGFKCDSENSLLQRILSVESIRMMKDSKEIYHPVLIDPLDIIVDTEITTNNITYTKNLSGIIKLRNNIGGQWRLSI